MAQDHVRLWVYCLYPVTVLLCLVKPEDWSLCFLARIMQATMWPCDWVRKISGFQATLFVSAYILCCFSENCGVKLI
jgi:hypothetical protein